MGAEFEKRRMEEEAKWKLAEEKRKMEEERLRIEEEKKRNEDDARRRKEEAGRTRTRESRRRRERGGKRMRSEPKNCRTIRAFWPKRRRESIWRSIGSRRKGRNYCWTSREWRIKRTKPCKTSKTS